MNTLFPLLNLFLTPQPWLTLTHPSELSQTSSPEGTSGAPAKCHRGFTKIEDTGRNPVPHASLHEGWNSHLGKIFGGQNSSCELCLQLHNLREILEQVC